MEGTLRFTISIAAVIALLLGGTSCSQEEVAWETTTGAVGANLADQETFDQRWRSYRVRVGSALEALNRTLEGARRQTSVADRNEIDGLTERIDRLRGDMLGEFDASPNDASAMRAELEDSFDTLRDDAEALLLRLGHDREEFSAWQGTD